MTILLATGPEPERIVTIVAALLVLLGLLYFAFKVTRCLLKLLFLLAALLLILAACWLLWEGGAGLPF